MYFWRWRNEEQKDMKASIYIIIICQREEKKKMNKQHIWSHWLKLQSVHQDAWNVQTQKVKFMASLSEGWVKLHLQNYPLGHQNVAKCKRWAMVSQLTANNNFFHFVLDVWNQLIN